MLMKSIPLHKTIRPTTLQPKIFSLIKDLQEKKDYLVIVDKNNTPVCFLASIAFFDDIDEKKNGTASIEKQMEEYYGDLSEDEKEWMDFGVNDGIS